MKKKPQKFRNPIAYCLAKRTGSGSGKHRNRVQDLRKGSSRKLMHKALIFASLLFCMNSSSANTFIDQVDEGSALICSNDSGEWVCKPISVEEIRELGYTDVEGLIMIEPTELEIEK